VEGEQRVDILVVDDRPEQRLSLSAVLAGIGANVITAASGRDALRWLLQREFAVVLLDVNMPEMDGFETAALIRQRARSEHTPIIFVTAYSDDTHEARGYSLGAVDYILTPVEPQVLRAKVSVFVELFRKRGEVTQQTELLRRKEMQLRRLADASLALHGARSVEQLLEIAADAASTLFGAQQTLAEIRLAPASPAVKPIRHVILRPADSALEALGLTALAGTSPRVIRLGREALEAHPQWGALTREGERRPLRGWLAAPLVTRDGRITGTIQLSEKREGDFTADDEALLVLLARKASLAIENSLFSEAEAASRLKDEFLATLSHELRTPLQAMLSWARLLRDEKADSAMLARGLEVIERSANAQTQLIDDLLDVSRIMSNKLRLELDTVLLSKVIETAIEDARPQASAGSIVLRSWFEDRPITVWGDPNRLRQVIGNLLSNAIKFTPKGGLVEVQLTSDGEQAEIRVVDTGEGIRADFLPYLFDRFRQGDSSSTRSHGGLGIGLAIVRHLVELHEGTVRAESGGEGAGSCFVVRLPLARGRQAMEEARRSRAAKEDSAPERLDGLRVLLVDDQEDTRECVAMTLRQYGAEVVTADSAAEALDVLERGAPDVLLSDIAMPGEDGLSLIQKIRRRPAESGGRIPAAALSAYARPEEMLRALRAGFDLHLAKPVRDSVLISGILDLARRPQPPA
jgi:signal transduction histidine kinase